MILCSDKTRVITFKRKTNPLNYKYILSATNIMCTECITDIEILLDSKILGRHHVDYIFSKSLKTVGSVRMLTPFLPLTVYCCCMLPELDLY